MARDFSFRPEPTWASRGDGTVEGNLYLCWYVSPTTTLAPCRAPTYDPKPTNKGPAPTSLDVVAERQTRISLSPTPPLGLDVVTGTPVFASP